MSCKRQQIWNKFLSRETLVLYQRDPSAASQWWAHLIAKPQPVKTSSAYSWATPLPLKTCTLQFYGFDCENHLLHDWGRVM